MKPSNGRSWVLALSTVRRITALAACGGVALGAPAATRVVTPAAKPPVAQGLGPIEKAKLQENYGRLPIVFEPNQGQADPAFRYVARTGPYTLLLADDEAALLLRVPQQETGNRFSLVRMKLPGAGRSTVRSQGLEPTGGVSNYFLGSDPSQWRTQIPHYRKVRFEDVYPGIDLVYYGNPQKLEYDFVVRPGGDPNRIELAWEGVEAMRTSATGDLVLTFPAGELTLQRPRVYQQVNGRQIEIASRYAVRGERSVRFQLARYDRSRPLVIDPILVYSTYLGGTDAEQGTVIAVDAQGSAYVAGRTFSANFPLLSAYQPNLRGTQDLFVTKLNPGGTALVYSTYLGGSGAEQEGGIVVNANGEAYVTGGTTSTDFPVTGNAVDTLANGQLDIFVTRLAANGGSLLYSTYIGGENAEEGKGIALDSAGNAYITGYTFSESFPLIGPLDNTLGGGVEAFVLKLNDSGSGLVYSTFLGGRFEDRGASIAVNPNNEAVVGGFTTSPDFPATTGNVPGQQDGFVARLNAAGSALVFSRYLGGPNSDFVRGLALDPVGAIYVTGETAGNFPTTVGAYQVNRPGNIDAFVTKMNATGDILFSTYLGGVSRDVGNAIAVDAAGQVYVGGESDSVPFPTTPDAVRTTNQGITDAFVTVLNATGTGLVYSTLLGGSNIDQCFGIVVDASGNIYASGFTFSTNFPATPNAYRNTAVLLGDAFVSKLGSSLPTVNYIFPNSGTGTNREFDASFSDPTGFAQLRLVYVLVNTTLSTANGCYIEYNRAANTLRLANDAGTAWLPPITPSTNFTTQNSQCRINGSASVVSAFGNDLVVRLALSFRSTTFSGAKNLYGFAENVSNLNSGWQLRGSWTVPAGNNPPLVISASPNVGSGLSQTFTISYGDADGFTDLDAGYFLINSSLAGPGGCFLEYNRVVNTFRLANDNATSWLGPATPGTATTLENSQCRLSLATSAAAGSGTALNVNFTVTFLGNFFGARSLFGFAVDYPGAQSAWVTVGGWNIPTPPQPPTVSPVTPLGGSGFQQAFLFNFQDPNGVGDISTAQIIFNGPLSNVNGCSIEYDQASNLVRLINDAGNNFVAGTVTPSVSGMIENSFCQVFGGGSSVSASGNNLNLTLNIIFKAAFAGAKNVFGFARDAGGLNSGFQTIGAWNVPGVNQPPFNVIVTPNSGTGGSQVFSFVYTDPNGSQDISLAYALFNSVLSAANGCFLEYNRLTNRIRLANDAATNWLPTLLTPGVAGTVENSQCILSGTGSSSAVAGASLNLTVSVTFKPAFAGVKNSYAFVSDLSNANGGWGGLGTWTVPGTTPPPQAVFVQPNFGAGGVQSFTFRFSDQSGFTDMTLVYMLFNNTLNAGNACFVEYNRVANTLRLANDAASNWLGQLTPGTAGNLENAQCILSGTTASAVGAGPNLDVTVPVTFKPAFAGARVIYGYAQDQSNQNSGWQTLGVWTVQ